MTEKWQRQKTRSFWRRKVSGPKRSLIFQLRAWFNYSSSNCQSLEFQNCQLGNYATTLELTHLVKDLFQEEQETFIWMYVDAQGSGERIQKGRFVWSCRNTICNQNLHSSEHKHRFLLYDSAKKSVRREKHTGSNWNSGRKWAWVCPFWQMSKTGKGADLFESCCPNFLRRFTISSGMTPNENEGPEAGSTFLICLWTCLRLTNTHLHPVVIGTCVVGPREWQKARLARIGLETDLLLDDLDPVGGQTRVHQQTQQDERDSHLAQPEVAGAKLVVDTPAEYNAKLFQTEKNRHKQDQRQRFLLRSFVFFSSACSTPPSEAQSSRVQNRDLSWISFRAVLCDVTPGEPHIGSEKQTSQKLTIHANRQPHPKFVNHLNASCLRSFFLVMKNFWTRKKKNNDALHVKDALQLRKKSWDVLACWYLEKHNLG